MKTHLSHLLDKLGARDRVQLVIVGYESGLLTPRVRVRPAGAASRIESRPRNVWNSAWSKSTVPRTKSA
ncbi:hypothetical protein [Kitasatospora sp. NPDC057936]|uniref:hypothetical protein n=1 Tax=Kitasatospora sp. NPDC057936 TaxID=3346283 RepID=UPI0036DA2F95